MRDYLKWLEPIFYTYVYLDPRKLGNYSYGKYTFNYEPFYIGKGHNERINDHIKFYNKYNDYKSNKIGKIINEGLEPIVIKYKEGMIECVALKLEIDMIKIIGRKNLGLGPLLNLTDGGDGQSGKIISKETKVKMSLSRKKRICSEETKEKLRGRICSEETKEKLRGRICSEETKEKISKSGKGKKRSDETKEKLRIVNLGRKHTDETKEKIKQLKFGKKHTEEQNEKQRQFMLGRKHTDETKEKIKLNNIGKKRSDETKEKIRLSRLGKIPWNKGLKTSEKENIW